MSDIGRVIDRLARFDAQSDGILSVYLATDPSRGPGRNLRAHVRDVLQPVLAAADGPGQRPRIEAEARRVHAHLEALADRPRGLALFASEPHDLFEAIPLRVPPPPAAAFGARPSLRPLLVLLDEYPATLILLVDKERARLFRWQLEELDALDAFEDDVPGRHAQGGESQANFQRHHDAHVLQHVRRAVDALVRHHGADAYERIAVAGPAEVLGHVRRLMPVALVPRIAGTIGVPVVASHAQILDAARALQVQWERAEEERLVADLQEQLGRGRAVFGPADVVDAVMTQRVRTLVIGADTRVPGARCDGCELLVSGVAPARCPACGGPVRALDDLVDRLAGRVLRHGGRVEEVRAGAAAALAPHGGIAATLLYPVPAPA